MPVYTSDGKTYEDDFSFWHERMFGPQQEDAGGDNKLFMVRHGDTDCNDEDLVHGWVNQSLNDKGIEQAHKSAESLKDKNITRIISSDLPRAKQTANIISKVTGAPVTFDPNLRTWDAGDFDYTDKHKEFEQYSTPVKYDNREPSFLKDYSEEYKRNYMENESRRALDNNKTLDQYMDNNPSMFTDIYKEDPSIRPSAEQAFNITKRLKQLYEHNDPDVRKMIDEYESGQNSFFKQHPDHVPPVSEEFRSKGAGTTTNSTEWDMLVQLTNTLLKDRLANEKESLSEDDAQQMEDVSNYDVIGRPYMEMNEGLKERLRKEFPSGK